MDDRSGEGHDSLCRAGAPDGAAPADDEASPAAGPAALPLESLPLPAGVLRWARARSVLTLGELARVRPHELLVAPRVGPKALARTREIVDELLGQSWLAVAARTPAREAPPAQPAHTAWDEVRATLPGPVAALRLECLDLPPGLCHEARRARLRTIGDLARLSGAELEAMWSPRPGTLEDMAAAARRQVRGLEGIRRRVAGGLLNSWRAALAGLDPAARLVHFGRSGLDGRVVPWEELERELGKVRRWLQVIEARALADLRLEGVWRDVVRERIEAALPGGAAPLAALADDPWWAEAVALPRALDYLADRVLGGVAHVVEVAGERYLARCEPAALDEAWKDLLRRAAEVPLPADLPRFRALAEGHRAALGEVLADRLAQELEAALRRDDPADGARVTGLLGGPPSEAPRERIAAPVSAGGGATPLSEVALPTRLVNWARWMGITTIEELCRRPPRELVAFPRLGPVTVAKAQAALEAAGYAWADPPADPVVRDPATARTWDQLRADLPAWLAATPLAGVHLPSRVRAFAARRGLGTVGELARISASDLRAQSHVGRGSVRGLFRAVRGRLLAGAREA